MKLKPNDTVQIKKEFLNSSENENDLYIVKEVNGDRVIIAPTEWRGRIVPTELVRVNMLSLV